MLAQGLFQRLDAIEDRVQLIGSLLEGISHQMGALRQEAEEAMVVEEANAADANGLRVETEPLVGGQT